MTTDLVFLDIETTGLNPRIHQVWEVAVATNDGPIRTYHLPHSLATADPTALSMNGYWDRSVGARATDAYDLELRELLAGVTVVGANPAFDTAFLSNRWQLTPWHHRLIDVESMGLAVLRHERPKGLHALAAELREMGHDIPEPDHSARADVATTRAVYLALREAAK